MSIPRSPKEAGGVILVGGGVVAILLVSWLMANLIIGIWQLSDYLEEFLWP